MGGRYSNVTKLNDVIEIYRVVYVDETEIPGHIVATRWKADFAKARETYKKLTANDDYNSITMQQGLAEPVELTETYEDIEFEE